MLRGSSGAGWVSAQLAPTVCGALSLEGRQEHRRFAPWPYRVSGRQECQRDRYGRAGGNVRETGRTGMGYPLGLPACPEGSTIPVAAISWIISLPYAPASLSGTLYALRPLG